MQKYSAKNTDGVDVLVVGDHPCAYLAAGLLARESNLRVVLATVADREPADRLVTINPALFEISPVLAEMKTSLPATPVHGLQFLHDKPGIASEHSAKTPFSLVAPYTTVQEQIARVAGVENFEILECDEMQVQQVDETGLDVTVGGRSLRPRVMVVGVDLPSQTKASLGIPVNWEPGIVHRFTFVRSRGEGHLLHADKKLMPMSLDLCGNLCWGWVLPGKGELQIMVEEPIEKATEGSGEKLLGHWVSVLKSHGVIDARFTYAASAIKTMDRPLAGALEHEGVANRTLLIGPAGGFYSACGEDIYPACWSAVFAIDVCRRALKEKHLQDALNPYRQKWRTTLGNYLRGPQQNLRFLLPLVYKNPAMTSRITEAILLSKSVVR